MKSFAIIAARAIQVLLLFCAVAVTPAYGQGARLDVDKLNRLAAAAAETVDINLDGAMLQLASKFLSGDSSSEESQVKNMIAGLKGIYVKSFEFEEEGQYSDNDINTVRDQLRAPAWSKLLGAKSKREGENVEVYTMSEGGSMIGLAIISANPKELTVINIVGLIDLDKLVELARRFGVPRLELEKADKPDKE